MKNSYLITFILIASFTLKAQQWQGQWSSSFGNIDLIENSIDRENTVLVFGNYAKSGTLIGVSIFGVLHGYFYDSKTQKGGRFKFNQDKTSSFFKGKWGYVGNEKKFSWNGSLINHKTPNNMRAIDRHRTFEGLWNSNFGPLNLVQDGVFVEGKYSDKGKLYGVYNQSTNQLFGLFSNKERYGLLIFTLDKGKKNFTGSWSWKTQNWVEQKWTGNKKVL